MSASFARAEVEPRAAAADRSADPTRSFEAFVAEHEGRIVNTAYGITGNIDDARDVAQHVLLQAYVHLERLVGTRSVERWLYVVTRNEALHVKRRRRRDRDAELFGVRVAPQLGPEELVLQNERSQQVHETIAQLPPQFRDVIYLRHIQSMQADEIADTLGIPIRRVKRDAERAVYRLRAVMMRSGLGADSANAG